MAKRKKRIFGTKINFKSLSCSPVNELGVVYLFGVLHEAFDFKIESIQSAFPDCIARRKVASGKWEELRIEFEYMSKNFYQHKHDPERTDIIVCWKHNWPECPKHIEIIELSSMLEEVESIAEEVKKPKKLSSWNKFAQQKRLEGLSFKEIAKLWHKKKQSPANKKSKPNSKPLSEYNLFCQEKRLEGLPFSEIGKLWREKKSNG